MWPAQKQKIKIHFRARRRIRRRHSRGFGGHQAWESLVTSKARISALGAEIRASTIALGVRQEAQVGSRTILDVLDAEQDLLNARVKLVRAEQSEVLASMDLKRCWVVSQLLASTCQ